MMFDSTYKRLAMAVIAAAMAGCASKQVVVQVHTQPPGGYVTETGTGAVVGVAPALWHFDRSTLAKFRGPDGCASIRGFEAVWVSGARAASPPAIQLCGKHEAYTTTITRDTNAPGLDKDLEFAARMSATNAATRQAGATEDAAAFQFLNLIKPR